MAVVASILTAIYHMLKDGTMYHDLGCDHFKRQSTDQQKKRRVVSMPAHEQAILFVETSSHVWSYHRHYWRCAPRRPNSNSLQSQP
jgi:hypothetical protein